MGERAERLRKSAQLVLKHGDLKRTLELDTACARKALAKFPMIGEPGADKILAFSGTAPILALDSNALRTLQRLGLAPAAKDYKTSYRQAQDAPAGQLPKGQASLIEAAQLLRQHGQELCRRTKPDCTRCPLQEHCPARACWPDVPVDC